MSLNAACSRSFCPHRDRINLAAARPPGPQQHLTSLVNPARARPAHLLKDPTKVSNSSKAHDKYIPSILQRISTTWMLIHDYNIGRQASSRWSYYPGSSMAFKRWHPDCLIPSLASSLVARMSEVSFCMHSSDGMPKCTHIDNLNQLTVLFSGTLWAASFDYYLPTHTSK